MSGHAAGAGASADADDDGDVDNDDDPDEDADADGRAEWVGTRHRTLVCRRRRRSIETTQIWVRIKAQTQRTRQKR
jgi:hypothetical protein